MSFNPQTKFHHLSEKESEELYRTFLEVLNTARVYRSCISCDHFDETKELCHLAGVRPPARTLVLGCPAYREMIPF